MQDQASIQYQKKNYKKVLLLFIILYVENIFHIRTRLGFRVGIMVTRFRHYNNFIDELVPVIVP